MTAQKRRPRIGDEKWEVEWCSKLAFYEDSTDVDRDNCEMSKRYFATRDEALAFAKTVWPDTTKTFGIVEVTPCRFVPYDEDDAEVYPHVGYWDYTAEAEIISDESGVPE